MTTLPSKKSTYKPLGALVDLPKVAAIDARKHIRAVGRLGGDRVDRGQTAIVGGRDRHQPQTRRGELSLDHVDDDRAERGGRQQREVGHISCRAIVPRPRGAGRERLLHERRTRPGRMAMAVTGRRRVPRGGAEEQ